MAERQYFQVVGWFKPLSGYAHTIRKDLSERELRREFLGPYSRGERILVDGETFDLMDLTSVEIIQTTRQFDEIFREMEDEHDQQNLDRMADGVFMLPGPLTDDAILEAGTNVTQKFITYPAGARKGPGLIRTVVEHPWVSAIVTTVIAALILAYVFGIGAPTPPPIP